MGFRIKVFCLTSLLLLELNSGRADSNIVETALAGMAINCVTIDIVGGFFIVHIVVDTVAVGIHAGPCPRRDALATTAAAAILPPPVVW